MVYCLRDWLVKFNAEELCKILDRKHNIQNMGNNRHVLKFTLLGIDLQVFPDAISLPHNPNQYANRRGIIDFPL